MLQDWGFRQLLPDCRIILEKSQVSEEGLRKLHSKYRRLRIEPRPRFVPENPINLSSAAEANIEGGAAEGVGHAIDGDLATSWTVQKWDTPRDHGARRRGYLELEWETKVGIQKIVVREAGDCLTHLRVLAFNRQTEKWNEVASLQAQGRKTFVMGSINPRDPRWVRIDGQRPDELGERELGSGDRKVHPVFEFILPNERTTQRLRFEILKASTDPVEISEIEIYGREIK